MKKIINLHQHELNAIYVREKNAIDGMLAVVDQENKVLREIVQGLKF